MADTLYEAQCITLLANSQYLCRKVVSYCLHVLPVVAILPDDWNIK